MTLRRRILSIALGLAGVLALLLGALAAVIHVWGPGLLKPWGESPGFRQMLSREVSKAMKVDGEFAPLTLDGWTATTASYTSTGWPGEAIGSLNAEGITGTFNPDAIFRRVWEVERIEIRRGTFTLRMPDDALKRPPAKGPKPWYAVFMPTRFFCPMIVCPDADVVFPFGGKEGKLTHLNLKANMIGRDFEYHADAGRFQFPMLPEMEVKGLNIFITREMVDIRFARLEGLDGDPARMSVQGRMGMRDDKSIKARVEMTRMPFAQVMPEDWKGRLEGRITAKAAWETDASGTRSQSDGLATLNNVRISNWDWLDHLARMQKNPDLSVLEIPDAACVYTLDGTRFTAEKIRLDVKNKMRLSGSASYDWKSKESAADLVIDDIPLASWLPETLKPRLQATCHGTLKWKGREGHPETTVAEATFSMPKGRYEPAGSILKFVERYGLSLPRVVDIQETRVDLFYEKGNVSAKNLQFEAPGVIRIKGDVDWLQDGLFAARIGFGGLDATLWHPLSGEGRARGMLEGAIAWKSPRHDLSGGNGSGDLNVVRGGLQDFGLQRTLARFLKRDDPLELDFSEFRSAWTYDNGASSVRNIRILAPGKLGVEGGFAVARGGALTGELWIGAPREWLDWLPEAETAVFTRKKEGLFWAKVTLSGTLKEPKHDLGKQIMHVLARHPGTMIELAGRGISWWLGDVLGTYEEPTLEKAARRQDSGGTGR
jgi:hypothetical protein